MTEKNYNPDRQDSKQQDLSQLAGSFQRSQSYILKAYADMHKRMKAFEHELSRKIVVEKPKEQWLQRLEQGMQPVLREMRTGFIAVNPAGEIVLFNPYAARLTGFSPAEVLGKNYQRIFLSQQPMAEKHVLITLRSGRSFRRVSDILTCSNGTIRRLIKSSTLVLDENQKVMGAFELLNVPGAQAEPEEEPTEHSESYMGRVSRQIAHVVRNPLAGIKGFAALLDRDLEYGSPGKRYTQHILEGVASVENYLKDLISLNRHLRPQACHVNLADSLPEVLRDAIHKCDPASKLVIRWKVMDNQSPAFLDPALLRDMIFHVLRSIVASLPSGGRLDIALYPDRSGQYHVLRFHDDGPPVNIESADLWFQPFAEYRERGSGLDLALAQRLVYANQGKIAFTHRKQNGCELLILFPRPGEKPSE